MQFNTSAPNYHFVSWQNAVGIGGRLRVGSPRNSSNPGKGKGFVQPGSGA